jgi:polar amino acid transport system substrate-binding protein
MKIVYYDSFPPYSWHDGDGIMKGLLVDISDAVLSEMGINVEHRGYPWGRAQNLVQNNKADAFITIATFDRKKYTYTSKEPVINGPITIFTSIKNPRLDEIKNIEEINDLKNFKILDYIGNGWGNSNLKDFDRSLVPNLSNALQMISAGRGDIVATDNMVAYYLMRHLELESQLIEIPILLDEVSFSLCIGKNSEYSNILDDFDKHMKKFRDSGKMNEIIELYTK